MQNLLLSSFSKSYQYALLCLKFFRPIGFAQLFLIQMSVFCLINYNAAAGSFLIGGITLTISGTGSTSALMGASESRNYQCSTNYTINSARYVAAQQMGAGTITYSSSGALTRLDVYFKGFNSNERIQITPPSGITVTAMCGVSELESGVYGGADFAAGVDYWQHIRFTSSEANAFSNIEINATTSGDGWIYYVPSDGVVARCTVAPTSNQLILSAYPCLGSGYGFRSSVTGTNLTYDWQYKNSGETDWTSISQANSGNDFTNFNTRSLNVVSSTSAHNGRSYRLLATNSCGSYTSNVVQVTVGPAVSIISQPLATQNVCSKTIYSWAVQASGSNLTYSWQFSGNQGIDWFNASQNDGPLTNWNTPTLLVRGADDMVADGRYYRVAIGTGSCTTLSNIGTVEVSPALPIPTLGSLAVENACPDVTVNLNSLITSTTPVGSSIVWRKTAVVADPTAVVAGTYKAYYYNSSFAGDCSSPASSQVAVTIKECTTLPVDLISFEGRNISSDKNELNWLTASEKNNDHFEVQSSSDARSFETIGWVEGNGTVNQQRKYKFVDGHPTARLVYYRLKQVDLDKTFQYSNIIAVKNENIDKSFVVYPNPVINELGIKLSEGEAAAEIRLFSLDGKGILQHSNGTKALDISSLKAGLYLIDVKTTKGESYRQQFAKE